MKVIDRSKAFKAYDIRGEIGVTLDARMAHDIGHAIVATTGARRVAVGADNRPSSPELQASLIDGLRRAGADVVDLGQTGTEQIYFAAQVLDVDFGVQITASHNPIQDNGMKFILRDGKPVTSALLVEIRDHVVKGENITATTRGSVENVDLMDDYVDRILGFVNPAVLGNYRILTNAGNGMAGPVIDAIETRLGHQGITSPFIKMHNTPDSQFPNGIPNPILPENRPTTISRLREERADIGLAWDGDFDRCFFYDERGDFIEGYYIVGLLAEAFLKKHGSGRVVYDPRLTWNTIATANRNNGTAVSSRVGHVFMKQVMREHDALYGGEMSAHHYFRDFAYCDSGMIPWLLLIELMHDRDMPLSALVAQAQAEYPCSGELNFRVDDVQSSIASIRKEYQSSALAIDETDGVSFEFADWRFNIRGSNTEPLLRLNVESHKDTDKMQRKTDEIVALINNI